MPWVIDRFEGNLAVLEDIDTLEIINLPRRELPSRAKEGDVTATDSSGKYIMDYAETDRRRKKIKKLLDKIKKSSIR